MGIGGTPVYLPWKSVESGRYDKLIAKIEGTPADSVFFSRESASMVMAAPGKTPGEKQLMITGQGNRNHDELFAWYRTTTGDSVKKATNWLAGAVNVVSYEKRTLKLCLVSVNNSVVPDAGYVQSEINKIYRQAVVSWEVTSLKDGLSVTLPRSNQKQLDNTDTNNQMDYTPEMKLVYNAMKNNPVYDKQTIYLFFFDEGTKDINGYMPFNRKFGFIFKYKQNPDEYLRTIAHELGHGAFRLKHPYPATDARMKTEDDLMAYSTSTRLTKKSWDECHDRDLGLNWGEGEEEGAHYGSIFFTPDWQPFAFSDLYKLGYISQQSEQSPKGTIRSINYLGDEYEAYFENEKFINYRNGNIPLEIPTYDNVIDKNKKVYFVNYLLENQCIREVYSSLYEKFVELKNNVTFPNELLSFEYNAKCQGSDSKPCIENYQPDNAGSIALYIHGTITAECLKSWTIQDRFALIKVLSKHIGQKWQVGGEYDPDEAILKILTSAPSDQIAAILDILKTEGNETPIKETYLSTFVNEMDEDALVYFGQWYNNCIISQEISKKRDYNNNKNLLILNQGRRLYFGQNSGLIKYSCTREAGKIKLTEYYENGYITDHTNEAKDAFRKLKLNDPLLIDPDQIVILNLSSDFTLGLETRYKAGDKIALTSIALWSLFEEKQARDLSAAIKVVAMVVTLPTALEGGWAGTFAIIDNVVLGSSLILDDANLKAKITSNAGKKWLTAYEVFVTLYFAGRASYELPIAYKALDNAYLDWRYARNILKEEKEAIAAFMKKIKDVDLKNIDDWINGIADVSKKNEVLNILKKFDDGITKKLDDVLANKRLYPDLADELITNTKNLEDFKLLNETEWYKFRLKYKQLKGENLSKDFNKYLDDFETGLDGKKIGNFESEATLGTHFDKVIGDKLANGKIDEIPGLLDELKKITGNESFIFDAQVKVKMQPAMDKPMAIPDNLAFEVNSVTQNIDKTKAYWIECKVDIMSPYRSNQARLLDEYVGNGKLVENRSLDRAILKQGDKFEIKNILQVSVNDNGMIVITIK